MEPITLHVDLVPEDLARASRRLVLGAALRPIVLVPFAFFILPMAVLLFLGSKGFPIWCFGLSEFRSSLRH